MGESIDQIHEVHTGIGDWAVQLGFIVGCGPVELATNPKIAEQFPGQKVWAFYLMLQGTGMSMVFPQDQPSALVERGRVVEAMRKYRTLMNLDNVRDVMKEAQE